MAEIDIAQKIGGIDSVDAARKVFEKKMDKESLAKIDKIKTEKALIKIANAIVMGDPDAVFVNTGSAEDKQWIRDHALEKGEEKKAAHGRPHHSLRP